VKPSPTRLFALALVDFTGAARAVALFGIIVVNVAGLGLVPPSVVRRVGLGHYAAEHKAEFGGAFACIEGGRTPAGAAGGRSCNPP
jgi:hypothetical protein